MAPSPSQKTWLARLAITALVCAVLFMIIPSRSPLPALHQRDNNADLNLNASDLLTSDFAPSTSNLIRRAFVQCDWATAALAAATAALGDVNPDNLDPCAKMVYKGLHLLCIMNSPPERVAQSTWIDTALDISSYGWSKVDNYRSFAFEGLQPAFSGLGINDDPTHRKEAFVEHDSDSRPDPAGPDYLETGGEYTWSFNPSDGALVALSSYSPDYMSAAGEDPHEGPIVPLKRWSDLTFLAWRAFFPNAADARGLKHVFRDNIHNDESRDGMKSILGRNVDLSYTFPGPWPGVSFGTGDAQGMAALTLPNVSGVVWLLAQHKLQLGIRVIDRVHIFTCPGLNKDHVEEPQWCIYLHIVDGPIGPGL